MTSATLASGIATPRTSGRAVAGPRRGPNPTAVMLSVDVVSASAVLIALWWFRSSPSPVIVALYMPIWVVTVLLCGRATHAVGDWARALATGAVVLPTVLLVVAEVMRTPASATQLAVMASTTAAMAAMGRMGVLAVARRGTNLPGLRRRVVIVADRGTEDELLKAARPDSRHFDVVGLCVLDGSGPATAEVPVMMGLERCKAAIGELGVDAVILANSDSPRFPDLRQMLRQFEGHGVQILVATTLIDVAAERTRIDIADGRTLIAVREPRHTSFDRLLMDAGQRLVAGLALVVVAPVLLVLGVLVRRESAGPAFFQQTRVGRDGKEFTMLKLRTMVHNAEALRAQMCTESDGAGLLFKLHNDPRVTPLGAWLRRFSLDELPQLINVCQGHMSLVGPRPALPGEVERYSDDVRRRLAVKPGLTGLWQVSGRSNVSWEQSLRLDQYYVDNWSFHLDFTIMLHTVGAVLRGRGAY